MKKHADQRSLGIYLRGQRPRSPEVLNGDKPNSRRQRATRSAPARRDRDIAKQYVSHAD
jgi:hypothetical protein